MHHKVHYPERALYFSIKLPSLTRIPRPHPFFFYTMGDKLDMVGWLEMKTMLGWSPRWCELRGKLGQFIRSHDKEDRTTRKLSDLKAAVVTLETGHSQRRYLEVAYARSPEAGVHTLRLRCANSQEASLWLKAIQRSQQYHLQRQPGGSRVFTITKTVNGTIGLLLKRASIDKIDPGGPADVAGLRVGMLIIRVCDTMIKLNDEMMTAHSIAAAPHEFEIEVKIPKHVGQRGEAVRSAVPRQLLLFAYAGLHQPSVQLPSKLLRTVSEFLNEGTKVLVVLWGWGNTVESRHVLVPGYSVTAADVHQILNADSKWLSARDDSSVWDSKAVYFAGPSPGPTSGKQRRILPSEVLSAYLGTGKGLALHMVSVEAKTHLDAFIASTEACTPAGSPHRGRVERSSIYDETAVVSLEEHQDCLREKDQEITRLKGVIATLRSSLAELRTQSGGLPWDEEEPSIVTVWQSGETKGGNNLVMNNTKKQQQQQQELRDRVVAAGTLEELESVDFPEGEADGVCTHLPHPPY